MKPQNIQTIRNSKFKFLMHELESWKEANLITQEQLSDIRAQYEVSSSFFGKLLVNLGAMLMGAALLSYIAANWMEFGRVTKISLILAIYVCTVLFAWFVNKISSALSRALLLLSSFAYGGGIFLIAQIFHEGGHYTTALLVWIIGIAPVCVLFNDRLQLALMQVLSVVYLCGMFLDVYSHFINSVSEISAVLSYLIWEIAIVAGLWALWLRTRGRLNFNLNVLVSIVFICLFLDAFSVSAFEIILCLFCFGVALSLIPRDNDINAWGIVLVGVCGALMTERFFWRYYYRFGIVERLDYIFSIIPNFKEVLREEVLAVCSGILTCTLMILYMLKGSFLAVFFFCAIILRFFFDKFYDFLPKSLMFAVGGIILVAAGLLALKISKKRNKKRTEAKS